MSDTYYWQLTMPRAKVEEYARQIVSELNVGEHFKGMSEINIKKLKDENARLREVLQEARKLCNILDELKAQETDAIHDPNCIVCLQVKAFRQIDTTLKEKP